MENIINITVEDRDGTIEQLEIPTDVNMSLMELLKAWNYKILATCGGIALCATCHVQIREGAENLNSASDMELDMLDTLPDVTEQSRLACQLRLTNINNNLSIKIKGVLEDKSY